MANTTSIKGNIIEITGLDADWQGSTDTGITQMKVSAIQFNPSAVDDVMKIRDGGTSNAVLFEVKCSDVYDQRIKYFNPPIWADPVIDISECTLNTPANAKVIITVA